MSPFKIVTNVVVQIIILLYLIDNNTETSWMILFGSGVGVLIEAWKVSTYCIQVLFASIHPLTQITKAVDISIIRAPPGSTIPYKLNIKGKRAHTSESQLMRIIAFR